MKFLNKKLSKRLETYFRESIVLPYLVIYNEGK